MGPIGFPETSVKDTTFVSCVKSKKIADVSLMLYQTHVVFDGYVLVLEVNELERRQRGTSVRAWRHLKYCRFFSLEKNESARIDGLHAEVWTRLSQHAAVPLLTALWCSSMYLCFLCVSTDCYRRTARYLEPIALTPLSLLASRRSEVVSASPRKLLKDRWRATGWVTQPAT